MPATNSHEKRDMKVLILGLGRTGTISLKAALDQLGYRCYHMEGLMSTPDHAQQWTSLLERKYESDRSVAPMTFSKSDFEVILGEYDGVADVPSWCFGPELMQAYPDAKVILMTREPDAWVKSMNSTIVASQTDPLRPLWMFLGGARVKPLRTMIDKIFANYFYGDFATFGKRVFIEHNMLIRALGQSHQGGYLEYQIKEGWKPICDFLGKEVPMEGTGKEKRPMAFPRLNDTEAFQSRFNRKAIVHKMKVAGSVLGVSIAGAVGGIMWLRQSAL